MPWKKLLLITGNLSIALAVLSSHSTPATNYEISIYQSTPVSFWILVFASAIFGTVVAIFSTDWRVRWGGVLTTSISLISAVSLPIIRSYYFYGQGDPLTHLGYVRTILDGEMAELGILYPGTHLLAATLHLITGLEVRRVVVTIVPIFVVVFILGGILCARQLTFRRDEVLTVGLSMSLLLPINWLGSNLVFHPATEAIFFFPFVFYAGLGYVTTNRRSYLVMLLVGLMTTLLIHPQQFFNVVVYFGTVSLVLAGLSGRVGRQTIVPYATLIASGLVFWLWTKQSATLIAFLQRIVFNISVGTNASSQISNQSSSLSQIGGSFEVLFLKLFFVLCVFLLLSTAVGLFRLYELTDNQTLSRPKDLQLALLLAVIPILGIMIIYYAVSGRTIFLRNLGFIAVIATVFGGITLSRTKDLIGSFTTKKFGHVSLLVVFILFLSLSGMLIHPGPYIYQGNQQVSEQQFTGYEEFYSHREESIRVYNVRAPEYRYYHAIAANGSEFESGKAFPLPDHFNNKSLPAYTQNKSYLVVLSTDRAYTRLYGGFRYSKSDYRYLEQDSQINRIHSNGGFELYIIKNSTSRT
ncbi:hypothetical protein [Haloferax sp. DFSO52]|uniref:hypothetical protein n=1 Tax=Haloferax sp. DFSO52 TaxID=3388505 RepID=UPI003A84C9FB